MSNLDNKYYRLVDDLKSGALSITVVFRAIRTYYEDNEDIPEGVRTLLSSAEGAGYLNKQLNMMRTVAGLLELAYRRGKQHGEEGGD
jgi:hypothetical protein